MPGFAGTLTLYIDEEQVGSGEIVTQPGAFCLVGDGICVGRDSASPVTPDYTAPFRFTGGTIDKVIVDVTGERYIDHDRRSPRMVHQGLAAAHGTRRQRGSDPRPRAAARRADSENLMLGAAGGG